MWTLPNILTLSRILGLPLLAYLMWWPDWAFGYLLAWVLYSLMGITDYLDGMLARSSGVVSKLGIFLDPIADKIMVATVILVLAAQGVLRGPYVGDAHVIAGLIILIREIAVSGLREFLGGLQVSVPVSKLAKWKTTFQLIALGSLILGKGLPNWTMMIGDIAANVPHTVGLITLWGAAILTVITGWDYLRVGLKHMD
ncbi:MAG: CDP-diacylglycerol--glycerol-3-phosphate 3-phosphatidyltransferase [Erythrobacter sp.]|nr:CDP-diacylglycerol--glycerol-3-phosphate 3-phosphatidyltransferase [Erythrobacter sp.]